MHNCHFQALSAYDIDQLQNPVDLIYSRFLLHHLNEPDIVIKKIHDFLKPKAIFISEEGICDHGFSYPPSEAFKPVSDNDEIPDKNIGKKLYYKLSQLGFQVQQIHIVQPVLATRADKALLLPSTLAVRESFLESGKTEDEWKNLYESTQQLINDDRQIVGFYASCQIAGIKI